MPGYAHPETLGDAIAALSADSRAVPLAGGTDLINDMRLGRVAPATVVDLTGVPGLDAIGDLPAGDGHGIPASRMVGLGAMVTMRAALNHPLLQRGRLAALHDAMRLLGGAQMQAVATIGGNLCHGSPAAETSTPLLVHDALARIVGPAGPREVPLEQFWTGAGRTALLPGELLTGIAIRPGPAGRHSAYQRLQLRHSVDIAIVGASAALDVGDNGLHADGMRRIKAAAIALSAVGPTPIRVPEAEALLVDMPLALSGDGEPQADLAAAVQEASRRCARAARAISDVRASADYRTAMIGLVAARAITTAARRAAGTRLG